MELETKKNTFLIAGVSLPDLDEMRLLSAAITFEAYLEKIETMMNSLQSAMKFSKTEWRHIRSFSFYGEALKMRTARILVRILVMKLLLQKFISSSNSETILNIPPQFYFSFGEKAAFAAISASGEKAKIFAIDSEPFPNSELIEKDAVKHWVILESAMKSLGMGLFINPLKTDFWKNRLATGRKMGALTLHEEKLFWQIFTFPGHLLCLSS